MKLVARKATASAVMDLRDMIFSLVDAAGLSGMRSPQRVVVGDIEPIVLSTTAETGSRRL
jgi:hypothetical protein